MKRKWSITNSGRYSSSSLWRNRSGDGDSLRAVTRIALASLIHWGRPQHRGLNYTSPWFSPAAAFSTSKPFSAKGNPGPLNATVLIGQAFATTGQGAVLTRVRNFMFGTTGVPVPKIAADAAVALYTLAPSLRSAAILPTLPRTHPDLLKPHPLTPQNMTKTGGLP